MVWYPEIIHRLIFDSVLLSVLLWVPCVGMCETALLLMHFPFPRLPGLTMVFVLAKRWMFWNSAKNGPLYRRLPHYNKIGPEEPSIILGSHLFGRLTCFPTQELLPCSLFHPSKEGFAAILLKVGWNK